MNVYAIESCYWAESRLIALCIAFSPMTRSAREKFRDVIRCGTGGDGVHPLMSLSEYALLPRRKYGHDSARVISPSVDICFRLVPCRGLLRYDSDLI